MKIYQTADMGFISSCTDRKKKMLESQLLKCLKFIICVFQLTFSVVPSFRLPVFLCLICLAVLFTLYALNANNA